MTLLGLCSVCLCAGQNYPAGPDGPEAGAEKDCPR